MVKSDLTKKADFTFYQIFGLGIFFLILFLFFILRIYPLILLFFKSSWHQLAAVCSCLDHLTLANHPFIFTALILISIGLLAFWLLVMVKIIKLKLLTNKFIKANLANRNQNLSPILTHLANQLNLKDKIIEINDQQPIVFCFGLIKSKICLSSGSIKKLSQPELRAVLLHEQHHLLSHEPLKIFIIKALTKILFFLPGIKYLADRVIEARVNKLADSGYRPKFKLFNSKLGLGLLLLILTFVFLNAIFYFSGTALASHDNSQCLLSEQAIISQCDMSF